MMAAGSMRGYTILELPPLATLCTDIFSSRHCHVCVQTSGVRQVDVILQMLAQPLLATSPFQGAHTLIQGGVKRMMKRSPCLSMPHSVALTWHGRPVWLSWAPQWQQSRHCSGSNGPGPAPGPAGLHRRHSTWGHHASGPPM